MNGIVYDPIHPEADAGKRGGEMESEGSPLDLYPAREGDPRRARFLIAALELAGSQGCDRTSVSDILERAGMARKTFYARFNNKAECFELAYAVGGAALCDRMLEAANRCHGWRAGVRAALTELVDFADQQPLIARALLRSAHGAGPRPRATRTEVFERLERALGTARPSPADAFALRGPNTPSSILVGVETVVSQWLAGEKPMAKEELLDELVELIETLYARDRLPGEVERSPAPIAAGDVATLPVGSVG